MSRTQAYLELLDGNYAGVRSTTGGLPDEIRDAKPQTMLGALVVGGYDGHWWRKTPALHEGCPVYELMRPA